jgi:hypothetical protein
MRCQQQIRQAQRIIRHPWVPIQKAANLSDANPRMGDGLRHPLLMERLVKSGRDDAIERDRH